jgi:hypothetical protein
MIRGGQAVTKPKLNFRFHNPNTPDELAKFLAKIIAGQKAEELLNMKYIPADSPPLDKSQESGIIECKGSENHECIRQEQSYRASERNRGGAVERTT